MGVHVELVERMYAAFAARDEAALRGLLAPDIEWIQNPGFPGGGHRRGVDEVLEKVFGALRDEWSEWRVEIDSTLDAGDTVVVLGAYVATHGTTGRSVRAACAHVYDIAEGRIARYRQYADTHELVRAARGEA